MPNNFLYIFCEGDTELAVLKNFLRMYWSQRFEDCEVVKFDGGGDLKAKFARDANQIFNAEPDSSILCLLDLYEEPFGVYDKNQMSHEQGFHAVRQQLMAQIKPKHINRFGAFPVVMELETWLIADPNIQREITQSYDKPEDIEHPAQELKAWRTHYNKRIDGKNLFNKVSVKRVYEDNCPHFIKIIDWLQTEPEKTPPPDTTEWNEHQAELLIKRDEATRKIEIALSQNDLEEAIRWDEARKDLEEQINQHAKTYRDNFD